MWIVLTGCHKQITLSFLNVGHTKFYPHTYFGLIKWLYRRTYVGCLDDIGKVVSNSLAVNKPQHEGAQDGSTVVLMYNWCTYFDEDTIKVPVIKIYHHFRFSAEHPRKVFMITSHRADEKKVTILKSHHNLLETFPSTITPTGLSFEWQLYLHEKICEFYLEDVRIICNY